MANVIATASSRRALFAAVDPYRAATHNKGIMNGVDPVVVATGNDWRAIEAGAHVWACRSGRYTSLSTWEVGDKGDLVGTLEMPMALGLVGGATKTHPAARAALKMLGVKSGAGTGRSHCRRRSGPEHGRAAGARDRGHPAGPYGTSRAEHRDRCRALQATRSRRSPPRSPPITTSASTVPRSCLRNCVRKNPTVNHFAQAWPARQADMSMYLRSSRSCTKITRAGLVGGYSYGMGA